METDTQYVEHYLSAYRKGRVEDAFHGLIEADPEIVPVLIRAYDASEDIGLKTFLIEVIGEHRRPVALTFLSQELNREEQLIWRSALNALAKIESPDSVEAMSLILKSITEKEKRSWIAEAIRDTTKLIKQKAEQGDV